jgi:hypothetical protein
MPDFLSNVDLWSKVLTLFVGIVTLITAVITLMKSRAEKAQVAQGAPLKLRSFRVSEPASGRDWGGKLITAAVAVVVVLNVLMVIAGAFTLFYKPSWDIFLSLAFFVACGYVNIRFLRLRWSGPGSAISQRSTISREATLTVQGSYDEVMQKCIEALRKMKVRVTAIDSKTGAVEAKTGPTWRSWGEIITIQISESGSGEYAVHTKSRARLEGTLSDWGKSASNVDRFFNELIH